MLHIELNFPEIIKGDWKIESFIKDGVKYQQLMHKGIAKMLNTPHVMVDFEDFLLRAEGSILINGLGMGMCNVYLCNKKEVTDLTVVEYDKSLVDFISPFFKDEPKCTIIHADALTFEPPAGKKYDYVWHDIWTLQSASNVKNIDFLKEKYKDIAGWQGAWRESKCRVQLAERIERQRLRNE